MRVFGEKVTQVLRSQLIKRLEDRNLRLMTNEFFNGLPTQPFDKRSARGIKAAVGYDSGSTILKLLQPVNFCRTGTAPNRTAVSKVGLNNASVKSHQTFFGKKGFACFRKPTALDTLVQTTLICSLQSRELSICTPRYFVF